jgi:hypothetical protein
MSVLPKEVLPVVTSDELLRLLRKRPFEPFRVHLTDGRVFDIRYPEMNLVGMTFFDIGVPEQGVEDPFADYAVNVPLDRISRIEPLRAKESVPQ